GNRWACQAPAPDADGAGPAHRLREGGEDRADRPPRASVTARGGAEARVRHQRAVRPLGPSGRHDAAAARRRDELTRLRRASELDRAARTPAAARLATTDEANGTVRPHGDEMIVSRW